MLGEKVDNNFFTSSWPSSGAGSGTWDCRHSRATSLDLCHQNLDHSHLASVSLKVNETDFHLLIFGSLIEEDVIISFWTIQRIIFRAFLIRPLPLDSEGKGIVSLSSFLFHGLLNMDMSSIRVGKISNSGKIKNQAVPKRLSFDIFP